jgi:competence protein ComEC
LYAAAVGLVVVMTRRRRHGIEAIVVALAIGVCVAAPSVAWHVHRLRSGEVPDLARRHAVVEAVFKLVRDPVALGGTGPTELQLADASVVRVDRGGWRNVNAPVVVLAHGAAWSGLLPGQQIQALVHVSPPRAGDDVAAVLSAMGAPVIVGRAPWWQGVAGRARASLRATCGGLPGDERGLLPSLVDGDTGGVPARLRADMRATGLSHLEAVSGENLSIVLAVALAAMRGAGFRRRMRVVGAVMAVAGFVVLARPSPSVQRAAVMSGVMLLAMFTGRRTSARSALALAVIALVVLNPFLARSVGFVLSVVATAGIVLLAPAWTKRLEARMPRLPRPVAIAVAVSAAAQLACTPVLVLAFGQLTPYAVPANLVAGPAVVPATVLGVLAAVVAPISGAAAYPLAAAASLPTAVVARTAHFFASFPGAASTVGRPLAIIIAAAAAALLWRAGRRAAVVLPHEIL